MRACRCAVNGANWRPSSDNRPVPAWRSVTPISRGNANALGSPYPGAFCFRRSQGAYRRRKISCGSVSLWSIRLHAAEAGARLRQAHVRCVPMLRRGLCGNGPSRIGQSCPNPLPAGDSRQSATANPKASADWAPSPSGARGRAVCVCRSRQGVVATMTLAQRQSSGFVVRGRRFESGTSATG